MWTVPSLGAKGRPTLYKRGGRGSKSVSSVSPWSWLLFQAPASQMNPSLPHVVSGQCPSQQQRLKPRMKKRLSKVDKN